MSSALRVCYFGTYDADYSRNRILINGLKAVGVTVEECHVSLWAGTDDKVNTAQSNAYLRPSFLLKLIRTYRYLMQCERQLPPYDVLVLGYTGQMDVLVAAWVALRRNIPLVLDVFMSLWLLVQERGLHKRNPLLGMIVPFAEYLATHLPTALVIDTPEYRDFLCSTYRIPSERILLIPTGADDHIFTPTLPATTSEQQPDTRFTVLLYCSFVPLHGINIVLGAAELLQQSHPDIHFMLVGDGPLWQQTQNTIVQRRLDNVTLTHWMLKDQLIDEIHRADICLGVFGLTRQSNWTIQNKIYECMSAAKPVITGRCAPVERDFKHGHDLWLCERGNPAALAEAILTLKNDAHLRNLLAVQGHETFIKGQYGLTGNGMRFARILEEIVNAHRLAHHPKH